MALRKPAQDVIPAAQPSDQDQQHWDNQPAQHVGQVYEAQPVPQYQQQPQYQDPAYQVPPQQPQYQVPPQQPQYQVPPQQQPQPQYQVPPEAVQAYPQPDVYAAPAYPQPPQPAAYAQPAYPPAQPAYPYPSGYVAPQPAFQQPVYPQPAPAYPMAPAAPAGGAMAVPNSGGMGFSGIRIGGMSYPQIVLDNDGTFRDNDGRNYGTEFFGFLVGSREKIVYLGKPVENNQKDVVYTYDDVTSNGRDVQSLLAALRAAGKTIERKIYLDVFFIMHAPGTPMHQEPRVLSIAPQSVERFGGFYSTLSFAVGDANVAKTLVRVYVGEKITQTKFPFRPWAFSRANIA